MIEGEHRVGLPAAEICLQLHYRIAADPSKPLGGPNHECAQDLREIGSAEELPRVTILGRRSSEELRDGKERASTCSALWSPYNDKKKQPNYKDYTKLSI